MPVVFLDLLSQAGLLECSAMMAAAGATLGFMLGAKSGHVLSSPRQPMQDRGESREGSSDASSADIHEWPKNHHTDASSAAISASAVSSVVRTPGMLALLS